MTHLALTESGNAAFDTTAPSSDKPALNGNHKLRFIAVLLAAVLGAASCGSNDDGAQKFEDVSTAIEDGDGDTTATESETERASDVAQQPALQAGSVDDNDDFPAYLAYQDQFLQSGLPVRSIDVTEHHQVHVVDANQRPVANALVTVYADGEPQAQVRTGNDGVALIHPGAYSRIEPQDQLSVRVDESDELTLNRTESGIDVLVLRDAPAQPDSVDLDVVFLLDATGSMGDEIGQLLTTVDDVAQRLNQLPGQPRVRLGLTHYRDEAETYLTRSFDLTEDVEEFRDALSEVTADGGGDYPEALDEGLAEAMNAQSWRDPATTTQIIFLIADAPAQVDRDVQQPYDNSLRDAAARGIKIFPIASSGSSNDAEFMFRQLAQFTGSRFVFLSYGAEGSAALGSETDISNADYDELPLNELIVRLVAEELEPLTAN